MIGAQTPNPPAGMRFNYVRYDSDSIAKQESLKVQFEQIATAVETDLQNGRARSLALTALEEAYMWVGKAIRDEQIARNSQIEHRPERGE